MESMVERMAKAIYYQFNKPLEGKAPFWGSLPSDARGFLLDQAEAVLKELRNPTEGMIEAAMALDDPCPETIWVSMVEAALAPGVNGHAG
jgi:hypothetical protein